MSFSLLGTKVGMTRVYDEAGNVIPVTVVQVGPCVVTQIKSDETDGYNAIQIAYGDMKPRNSTMAMIGHDHKAGAAPKRHHLEFKVSADELGNYELGQTLSADMFEKIAYVDVIGTSKGKGFAGGMKRYGFKGQQASHGVERKHRSPGSIAGHASNPGKAGRIKKGKRMAGHMGDVRITVRSTGVVRIDNEQNLVLVKGPVPGANSGLLEIRPSVRLYKNKSVRQAELAKS